MSVQWPIWFEQRGHLAQHWSNVGNCDDSDTVIFQFAINQNCIVLTNDLDFGTLLALSNGRKPSVIQARLSEVLPDALGPNLEKAIKAYCNELESGAIVTLLPTRNKIRILPLK